MLKVPSCSESSMSSRFRPGSSADTVKPFGSSCTSSTGVQPFTGVAKSRSISSRNSDTRPKPGQLFKIGRCHVTMFIIFILSVEVVLSSLRQLFFSCQDAKLEMCEYLSVLLVLGIHRASLVQSWPEVLCQWPGVCA